MEKIKFPQLLNYTQLKQHMNEQDVEETQLQSQQHAPRQDEHALHFDDTAQVPVKSGRTGTRLRSYAFAVLTRREYSKVDLIEKLSEYAQDKNEVIALVDELARENYQSDQRFAEMLVRSQVRQGKGPNRVKLALRAKNLDKNLVQDDFEEIDWYEQAYLLKVKKYGVNVSQDAKQKAKQIRFLQYRGFEMDAIMKAITRKEED